MESVEVTVVYLVHYDTLLQNATDIITKCDSYFITKYDKCLLQNASGLSLENTTVSWRIATVVTKCVGTYTFAFIRTNFQRKMRMKPTSCLREVFCKEGVLRNFAKFTVKHLCQSFFLNKVADLGPASPLKKTLWHRFFPVNFAKLLKTSNTPFTEHLRWPPLENNQK